MSTQNEVLRKTAEPLQTLLLLLFFQMQSLDFDSIDYPELRASQEDVGLVVFGF